MHPFSLYKFSLIFTPFPLLLLYHLHSEEALKLCFKRRKKEGVFSEGLRMARTVGRNLAAPLMFLNLVMYFIVLGFSSWCINRYIQGQTYHPSMHGNGATPYMLTFAILASVIGIASKIAGGNHLRAWRSDSLAAAGSSALVAWAVTALAFGFACKEISLSLGRGWRLRVLEGFIIVLAFTQLLYVLLLHAGMFSTRYGPGYNDPDYGLGGPAGAAHDPKATGVAGPRV